MWFLVYSTKDLLTTYNRTPKSRKKGDLIDTLPRYLKDNMDLYAVEPRYSRYYSHEA